MQHRALASCGHAVHVVYYADSRMLRSSGVWDAVDTGVTSHQLQWHNSPVNRASELHSSHCLQLQKMLIP